jgi:hypothetical protein
MISPIISSINNNILFEQKDMTALDLAHEYGDNIVTVMILDVSYHVK